MAKPTAALSVTAGGLLWILLAACSPTGVAVGAAAKVGTAAVKEKGLEGTYDDTVIRAEINHLWLQADADMYGSVGLAVDEGRVLLTGLVKDTETRVLAVRLAWQVDGVREVINEIQIEDNSVTGFALDAWIVAQLRASLVLDLEVYAINYSFDASDRVVYVIGIARSQDELDRVIGHAKDIPYVRRVINYVRVKVDGDETVQERVRPVAQTSSPE